MPNPTRHLGTQSRDTRTNRGRSAFRRCYILVQNTQVLALTAVPSCKKKPWFVMLKYKQLFAMSGNRWDCKSGGEIDDLKYPTSMWAVNTSALTPLTLLIHLGSVLNASLLVLPFASGAWFYYWLGLLWLEMIISVLQDFDAMNTWVQSFYVYMI